MPAVSFALNIIHGNCLCQMCHSLSVLSMMLVYARYVILSEYNTWYFCMPDVSFSQDIEHGNCLCQMCHSFRILNMVIVYARYDSTNEQQKTTWIPFFLFLLTISVEPYLFYFRLITKTFYSCDNLFCK